MPRKAMAKPNAPAVATRWRFPTRASLATAACVTLLGGVVSLGLFAATMIAHRERFTLPLSAIEFDPPPWVEPANFLTEVRYLGELPDKFYSQDDEAVEKVRRAFAKHPWVESVGGGYTTVGRRYVLTVVFRRPALQVTTPGGEARMVDTKGVLLPAGKRVEDLPVLIGTVGSVPPPAGAVWDDPIVNRAAELVSHYDTKSIAKTAAGWRITERKGRVLVVGW